MRPERVLGLKMYLLKNMYGLIAIANQDNEQTTQNMVQPLSASKYYFSNTLFNLMIRIFFFNVDLKYTLHHKTQTIQVFSLNISKFVTKPARKSIYHLIPTYG